MSSFIIQNAEGRLEEWRESARRVGADTALTLVLSWYENVNLDVLSGLCAEGKYVTNPKLVRQPQECAYLIAGDFAQVHDYYPNPFEEPAAA
jgi:hypothetical protein